MAALVTEDELRSGTWLTGSYGARYGVCHTGSSIVKFAPAFQSSQEVTAIEFVRQNCPRIPVPEVLGTWEVTEEDDGDRKGYFAMSVLPGSMLRDAWPTMADEEKTTVLDDMATILADLRQIPVPEEGTTTMIGGVDGIGKAADARAGGSKFGGPFPTEADFNDWLVSLIHPDSQQYFSDFYVDTLRTCFSVDSARNHRLRFTHGDLGMHNFLVQDGRITGLVDWEYAGWYPEYWEYVKMIQFSRDKRFMTWCQHFWEDDDGSKVSYDREFVVDSMLDSQIRHGHRVARYPRWG
ncbi:hypothetical protein DV738_g216, partial [Chaetothyriales sp. CBS 135597]